MFSRILKPCNVLLLCICYKYAIEIKMYKKCRSNCLFNPKKDTLSPFKKNKKFVKKFVDSKFVKTCDELVPSLCLVTPPSCQSFIRCLVHMPGMNKNSSNTTGRGIKIFVGTPASKIYVPIV